jgi:hypothetical protein
MRHYMGIAILIAICIASKSCYDAIPTNVFLNTADLSHTNGQDSISNHPTSRQPSLRLAKWSMWWLA